MYSLLDELDKFIKKEKIPFRTIYFHKRFLPDYVNKAILREIRKSSNMPFTEVLDEYQIRYDESGNIYLLIINDIGREKFVVDKEGVYVKVKFNYSGKSEKHIVKMGCLFKLLENDIRVLNNKINNDYSELRTMEKARLRYELIDDMLEEKYHEMVKQNKQILYEVDYIDDLINSTYKLKDYIRYLKNEYYGIDSPFMRGRKK